jgi:ribosomal protein S18 acetylase RimI-like enzyme
MIHMSKGIILRDMTEADIQSIHLAFTSNGWHKPAGLFPEYFEQKRAGKRDVIIAQLDGSIAGYVTIFWETEYEAFRQKGIPELKDLIVLVKYRRQGIATKLMDEAEKRISKRSKYSGLGVGLYRDYGNAQNMYAKRGYVPDGQGICYKYRELEPGQNVKLDDDLCLMMIKEL